MKSKLIRASWGPDPVVALHLRGTDKVVEQPNLPEVNAAIVDDAIRRADAMGARIFLITDSSEIEAELSRRLGSRLLRTDAVRRDGSVGLHKRGGYDVRRLAIDVMVDAYLAARCDEFFGCTASNVACMVARMRSPTVWAALQCGVTHRSTPGPIPSRSPATGRAERCPADICESAAGAAVQVARCRCYLSSPAAARLVGRIAPGETGGFTLFPAVRIH